MSKETNIDQRLHRGHRERMRKRFAENGGRDLEDHELLELLLYYVIPRADTNKLAHNLLNEFGSFREVLNADPARIEQVVGAGKATATFLSVLFAVKKRADTQKYSRRRFVADSIHSVGNYLVDYFSDSHDEEICMMMLDNSLKLIGFKTVSCGSVNSVSLDVRAMTKFAVVANATYVILAHNHPSGKADPSPEDKQLTTEAQAALDAVGITLIDHIVVNNIGFRPTMYMRSFSTRNPEYLKLYKKFYEGF